MRHAAARRLGRHRHQRAGAAREHGRHEGLRHGDEGPGVEVQHAVPGRAVEFVHGYSAAVVWTEAESDFICFEPLTSPVDALRTGEGLRWAQPGEEYTAVF